MSCHKILLLSSCALLSLLAQSQIKYTVRGKIGKLDAPNKMILSYWNGSELKKDTADIKKGAFIFKGSFNYPVEANLRVYRADNPQAVSGGRGFYLTNGTIEMSGDSITKMTVKGGQVNKDYDALHLALRPIWDKSVAFSMYYRSLTPEERKSPAMDSILRANALSNNQATRQVHTNFIRQYPNSMVSLFLLRYQFGKVPDVREVGPLYKLLSDDIRNSVPGKKFGKIITLWEHTNIGQTAPDFTQKDTLGQLVSLSQFRGKYVLLNFWATWCGPCMTEKRDLKNIYANFRNRNFEILDVSITDTTGRISDRQRWTKMVRNMNLPWISVYGDEARELYGIESVPNNFLLDPEGKIIAANLHGPKLEAKLETLLTK
ncbi:MAG: AhpC/TSA family protein [Chitinophagaceae bacterium]|nr:AhpC/TSA family protein [Chitinophagaceae bacterium]